MNIKQLPTKVTLTSNQQKHFETIRIAASVQAPFFANYYYGEMEAYPTLEFPTLATDSRRLFFNPLFLESLHVQEGVFVFTHEIWHTILRHPQRMKHYGFEKRIRGLPFDSMFYNVCADLKINASLVDDKIGRVNPSWLYHPDVKATDLVEDIYVKYYKPPPPPPPGSGGGGGDALQGRTQMPKAGDRPGAPRGQKPDPTAAQHGGRFDEVLEPHQPGGGAADELTEGQFKEAIARAAAAAKAMGKLSGNIERLVDELLEPQISWKERIHMAIKGQLGRFRDDWTRPNRRRLVLNPIVILPSKAGHGAGTVACVIDTSGSIRPAELQTFLSEVGGILRQVKPRRIVVIWCDATVRRVDWVHSLDGLEHAMMQPTPGGGGTDFRPPFQYIEKENIKPETLVYLTDMYGSFPHEAPRYPVVWCATSKEVAPFGETVRIEV